MADSGASQKGDERAPSLHEWRRRREALKCAEAETELAARRGDLIEKALVGKLSEARTGRLARLGKRCFGAARCCVWSRSLEEEVRTQLRYLADKPIDPSRT